MAHYLVTARATGDLSELRARLESGEIRALRPFGKALERALENARRTGDGALAWEEEDYCSPPLAQERAAVLDAYFFDLSVERVEPGAGWRRLERLPRLWDDLITS